MNYIEHYNRIIERGLGRNTNEYTEKHHIVPKCLGGNDKKENLVRLTAREHFVAHILLVKIYPKEYGLIKAVNMMCCESEAHSRNRTTNRMYGWLRERFVESMSLSQRGEKNSQFDTMWICNIELQENKKIKKDEEIPEGWMKGRNVWNKIKICPNCGIKYISEFRTCSYKCKQEKSAKYYAEKTVLETTKNKLSVARKGKTGNGQTGSKWMKKEEKRIKVPKIEIESYLDNGWVFGKK